MVKKAWDQNAAGRLEKQWINLETEILPTSGTGKITVLVWHHDLWDLMLGASSGLELIEMVPTKYRNPEETEEDKT